MDFSKFENMIKDLFDPQFSLDYTQVASWSSMQSLIVVSAIDEHYDVLITHIDLKNINTIEELYLLVVKKAE